MSLSPKEIQDAMMLTLLVTAVLLALACDIVRIQALRRVKRARVAVLPNQMTPRTTLVPR